MIQKKRYGGFAAARRRVYAAGSVRPPCAESCERRKQPSAVSRESTALCTDTKRIKIFKMILREEMIV